MNGNDKVAAFVRDMSWETVPEAVRSRARISLLDNLGVVLAGTMASISRERAVEIVRQANKAGLMQTGEVVETDGRVTGAICNCCADCCYPHLVSARLGAEKLWPRSRYVACHLTDECTACARCVRRCPFGAFKAGRREAPDTGAAHLEITFHEDLSRGCGVCVTGCPADAIAMEPLPENGSIG